jgi:hypothetical protein
MSRRCKVDCLTLNHSGVLAWRQPGFFVRVRGNVARREAFGRGAPRLEAARHFNGVEARLKWAVSPELHPKDHPSGPHSRTPIG